jgi:DNA-binding LacI/PurR family transcriptional regulator
VRFEDAPGVAEGARLQVDHLGGLGHRRIAFAAASDPRLVDLVRARAAAVEARAAARGIELADVRHVDPGDGSAASAVRRWRKAGITAVAAYNDDIAAAVVGSALRQGVSVPDGLAVIGHDDSPLASLFVPSLSSVRMDAVQAGRFLAEVALREAEGRPLPPTDYTPDTRLVVRESTAGR